MIAWALELVDRWRQGPELRAAHAAHVADVGALQAQVGDLSHRVLASDGQARLLLDFIRSNEVKARCRGGCGDMARSFSLHLVDLDGGGQALVPICEACKRAHAREPAMVRKAEAVAPDEAAT